jgi:hypothetical protein
MKKPTKSSPDKEMLKAFEAAGLVEYMEYLESGRRIMMTNFKAGVARGLGLTLGMSLVIAIIAWIVALLVDLPVVGEYAQKVEEYMEEYRESTNYTDEFNEMNEILRQIDDNTSPPGVESVREAVGVAEDPNGVGEVPDPVGGDAGVVP